MLESTAAPDASPRFVSTSTLTLLNIQQLPTCLSSEGTYLDIALKQCKAMERRVLSPLHSDLLLHLPASEKNQTSWTLSFWL